MILPKGTRIFNRSLTQEEIRAMYLEELMAQRVIWLTQEEILKIIPYDGLSHSIRIDDDNLVYLDGGLIGAWSIE